MCYLLITKHGNETSIKIGDEIIEGSNSVKHAGGTFDNNLGFGEHITAYIGQNL